MRHHNNLNKQRIIGIAVLLLCLATQVRPASHSSQLADLQILTLSREEQSYYLPLTANHSSVRMRAVLEAGRSWFKEALCKVCDLESDTCDKSCFADKSAPRISCDSSFCSEKGEYSDQSRGVEGKEVEMFVKVGKESQVLMPLILANKLYQPHVEMGQFHIFDPESSFNSAILSRTPSNSLQLRNINKLPSEQAVNFRQKELAPLKISMDGEDFDFSFLKSKKLLLHHVSKSDQYDDFTDQTEYDVDFSLQTMAVGVPIKLAKKIQKHLNEEYLNGMKCRLLPKRLKCSGQVDMQEVFKTVLHFQLNQYQFMLPLHLLITACSSNECTTLINFDESQKNTIIFGSVIWELYNLEYSINKKYAIFHRKVSQFDDLFDLDTIKLSEVSFLYGLWLIVFHTLRYIFIALFWLAVLSVIVHAILQWRSILTWFRSILLKRKQGRALQQASAQFQQFQQKPLRKISKLNDPYEDSQNI